MHEIKKVAVLTSGGDAPGMNACIRAVTRAAIFNNMKVIGVYRGYEGLINEEFKEFTSSSVSNTIQRGGTILKTARSKAFLEPEGRKRAYENMVKNEIDALIVIGGNGSLTGAQQFAREYDIPIIGLPGTIDNDLYGTDHTIGYDTALNTIVDCSETVKKQDSSYVLFRFYEIPQHDRADSISTNTNTQSAVKARDLRSNDKRVLRLKKAYEQKYPQGYFATKRGDITPGDKDNTYTVELASLGKNLIA